MKKPFNFTVGADPEFNLVMQGRRFHAASTLEEVLKDDTELTSADMGFDYVPYGNIGWDGANATAEIRPMPADTIEGLVNNIEKLIIKLNTHIPLLDMTTLSYYSNVGGHIHFSLPNKELTSMNKINAFHKKIASFYLPILLSENKINLQIRLKGSYGQLTDCRGAHYDEANIADTGNHVTPSDPIYNGYEFRTPSAEWLTTKKIAQATLAYVATVYNEVLNHPLKIKQHKELFYTTSKQAEALQMLALSDYKTMTTSLFKQIKKAVKTFEFYPVYKQEIDYILNPEKVQKDKKKARFNIATGWKISKLNRQPNKKDLTNKKKIAQLANNTNLDMVQSLINISYNDDTNVLLFVKEFIERIALYNWKLKNTYFLFGTRKDIDNYIVFDTDRNVYQGKEMIKTIRDHQAFEQLSDRMLNKFKMNGVVNDQDLLKDLNEKDCGKQFLIGIPYQNRMENKTNPFFCLVHDLENKKQDSLSLENTSWKNLPDDTGYLFEQQGKIWQIMNRTASNTLSQMVPDLTTSSNSARNRIINAIQDLGPIGSAEE